MEKEDKSLYKSEKKMKLEAIRRTIKNSTDAMEDPLFMKKCMDSFMEEKIAMFPKLCDEVRRVNKVKKKQFAAVGNEGGWSEKKDFKFDFSIPNELYTFMVNLVAREFWNEDNEKHWRAFMNGIMKGEEPTYLLYRAKLAFKGNDQEDKLKVTN